MLTQLARNCFSYHGMQTVTYPHANAYPTWRSLRDNPRSCLQCRSPQFGQGKSNSVEDCQFGFKSSLTFSATTYFRSAISFSPSFLRPIRAVQFLKILASLL